MTDKSEQIRKTIEACIAPTAFVSVHAMSKADPLDNPSVAAKLAKKQSELLAYPESKKSERAAKVQFPDMRIEPWPEAEKTSL